MELFWNTYVRFLEHSGLTREEVTDAMTSLGTLLDRIPKDVKRKVEAELNTWGRDDFVDLGGFQRALEVLFPKEVIP